VHGEISADTETLVRVHEPTSVLDLLDAESTGHSWGVDHAVKAIQAAPSGVLVLLNCDTSATHFFDQVEGWSKWVPNAITSPDQKRSSRLDLRTYGIGAQILRDLGVGQMKLLARPRKMPSIMPGFGLNVTGYDQSNLIPTAPDRKTL
jgi:3,4-dihydroxy 2-butanone 4-phosphate synthase/GTP cyclohydrolase II